MNQDQNRGFDKMEMYDINADWKFAEDHGQASLVGIPKNDPGSNKQLVDITLCKCCLRQIHKEHIPICENVKQLDFIGFGFPLYFSLIKCCILVLFVHLISYSIYEMYNDIVTNQEICKKSRLLASSPATDTQSDTQAIHCYTFMIEASSLGDLTPTQVVVRLISFFAHIAVLLYVKQKQYGIQEYLDQKILRISQYAILIQGLPLQSKIQQRIKTFLESGLREKFTPQKIILIQHLEQLEMYETQMKEKVQKKKLQLNKNKNIPSLERTDTSDNLKTLDEQIQFIKQKKNIFIQKQCKLFQQDQLKSQKAIVMVNNEEERNDLLDCFKQLSHQNIIQYFGEEGGDLSIQRAPQPRQIIWKNINYSRKKKTIRTIVSWILSLIFIGGIFIIFFFILKAKASYMSDALHHYSQDPVKYGAERRNAIAIVYISLVAVIFFNKFIMGLVLHKMSELQKHSTTASLQLSYAIKYALCMFFTTALMTLAVEAISFNNYFSHQYGVIEQETVMYFLNGFLVPLIWLVNPWHIFRFIKRKIYYGSTKLSQQQANNLMEQPSYDMGKRIAQITKTMWFTFVYATLIPQGCIINIFSLIFYYWVDKYNLFNRSSLAANVSSNLPTNALIMIDFTVILMPAGTLLFDSHIRGIVHPSSIAMLVIGVVFLIMPKNKILRYFIDEKFELRMQAFNSIKYLFIQNYQTLHPIIQQIKLKKHLYKRKTSLNVKTQIRQYNIINPQISQNIQIRKLGPLKNVRVRSYKDDSTFLSPEKTQSIAK